ncbi:hypothetical protein [uncultured Clostridium sp.]|uniref:hypothetical protein n=1 Tax=uncultured Clostridium sp. TaxID=59620 RepID=UPI0025E47885|nr:hypothetical protein [uncultured Clostridium sp.]
MWIDSARLFNKENGEELAPYADIYINLKNGPLADFSAIDGINSTDAPVMVISGSNEEVYI